MTEKNKKRHSFMQICKIVIVLFFLFLPLLLSGCAVSEKQMTGVGDSELKIDLIGDDFSPWQRKSGDWQVVGDAKISLDNEKRLVTSSGEGVIVNGTKGNTVHLLTRAKFGDVMAHIEFMVPKGSNSGVYFMGRYEIQVYDSWGAGKPKYSDCGGIYQRGTKEDNDKKAKEEKGYAPLVNASREPGQWQSFDVIFRAPRFDEDDKKIANARFEKVVHNGVLIHKDVEVFGPTRASKYKDEKAMGLLMLQGNHGPVAYRNIRIVPLDDLEKLRNAVLSKATVTPKKARKLLIFTLCNGYKHSSIPYISAVLEMMGRKTGAYEVVVSKDMSMFQPETLKQFDAVCFNNTTKLDFNDPALQKSLLDFVKQGGGIVGIHAATDNFYEWPEAAEMLGGLFDGHPWLYNGTWAVKLDEPTHLLQRLSAAKILR